MSKHTKGPWTASGFDEEYTDQINIKGDGFYVAAAIWMGNPGEQEANARLIAAAPELLEALEAVLQQVDDDSSYEEMRADIRAAIAKATGEA